MDKCINTKHPEFIKLAKQANMNPLVLKSKIGVWQEKNNSDDFPTLEELLSNNPNPRIKLFNIKEGVSELFESNPELANSVYEALGFDVTNLPILDTESITTFEGTKGAAQYDRKNNIIKVNRKLLKTKFEEKAWTSPRKLIEILHDKKIESYVEALPENQFENYNEWEQFVINHEYQHSLYSRQDFNKEFPNGTKGEYESEINRRALNQITPEQKQEAQQLYSQYLDSLNKPNTNPILQGNQNPDVILPIGTSGSGKSTFIKSLPQENLVVIEPDAMRVEFTGDMNNKSKDKEIYEEAANRAIQAIKQGKQVVFDTTNLTKAKRLPFIEAIKKAIPTANIQYKLMELNPELAKQRIKAQLARGENRAAVSDETIDRHAASYKQMLEDIKNEPITEYKELGSKQDIEGFKEFVRGKQFQKLTAEEIAKEQNNSLFGLNTQNQEQLEFHVNTLNVVSKFLENAGVEQRLVSEFLSQDGSIVDGALAAANFIEGTVDIIDDLNKGRAKAWNKLPEEASHWWYRLLNENSPLKKALWESHQTALKNDELYKTQYGKLVKSPSDLTEESIGQLIAEAIKRIEDKNGAPEDYSFFKEFLEWINSIIDIFKTTTQDPFEVAAMKILSSDMSDLMTWEEYRKLNNIVNFADVLTEQSVAPIDYTLIEDLGKVEKINEVVGFDNNGNRIVKEKLIWSGKNSSVNSGLVFGKTSPSFFTQSELDNWVYQNFGKEYDKRQKQILQEVRDNQIFFDRLLNKTFRKKSKFLPKTLRKYFDIIDAQNFKPLREWNISQELHQITKKLTPGEKRQLIETNGYTNIAPTLKVLPDLLQKYRKNPIVLSETIKVNGAKKQELSILNGIKEMIRLENPNLKSITAEEFVNEAHNWLQTNYLLGFANEKSYLSYRIDQTFSYLSDRQSNKDVDITNMTEEELRRLPLEERQRIANIIGLTKQNPDVYHNKVSLRFNDMYHLKSGHFQKSPSAWGNLTYFYTGKNKWKDAVLLHEIQNDNIEALRNFKTEKVDLETSLGRYLQQLYADLVDNITRIESGGKKIIKRDSSEEFKKTHFQLNCLLLQLKDLPLGQGLLQLKQNLNEQIELYKSDPSKNLEKAQEVVEKAYSQRRIFQDFQRRGGIKSLLTKEDLQNLEDILKRLNKVTLTGNLESQFEPGFPSIRRLGQKKQDFEFKTIELQAKITKELQKMYGDNAPLLYLTAPAKPLPKSQRNMRTVGYGQNQTRVGGASQELNENVNWLLAYSEKKILDNLSKTIEESKKKYVIARNATNAYNFNVSLSKITQEQYNTLIENFKYNQDLLNRLIDEQARKDIQKQSSEVNPEDNPLITSQFYETINGLPLNTKEVKNEVYFGTWEFGYGDIYYDEIYYYAELDNGKWAKIKKSDLKDAIIKSNTKDARKKEEQSQFESLKQQALDKKAELEKNYGKIEEEVKQTLEIEMNYFTPLVHHLIQKHINQYGKDFPMYFSGYQITKLTQGNDRTAWIYAGKDEISFTKEESDFIKYKAAQQIGLVEKNEFDELLKRNNTDESPLSNKDKEIIQNGIKKLNQYKRQSKQNLDRVINTIMNISNNKPIETGAIYNAMTQISGIKLIWQDKIEGLQGNTGGYLVDLTNYNYNTPILYGLNTSRVVPNEVNYQLKIVNALINLTIPKSDTRYAMEQRPEVLTLRLNSKQQPYIEINIRKRLRGKGVNDTQIDFIFDYMKSNNIQEISTEELALELASKYGYSVEVNTAKTNEEKQVIQRGDNEEFTFNGFIYEYKNGEYLKDDEIIDLIEYESAKHEAFTQPNTQYYSNLSAPGGTGRNKYEGDPDWEYQELEFKTPLITPSIKGHAQFATDKGIGWARVWYNKKTGVVEIQEIQSDLFQQGRNNKVLSKKLEIRKVGDTFTSNGEQFTVTFIDTDSNLEELITIQNSQGRTATMRRSQLEKRFDERGDNSSENQFLQLLNKNNNWVTFFIKSIIQDSAKKGYEKVLFPKGETAAKIEGHVTIADEINTKKEVITQLKVNRDVQQQVLDNIDNDTENFISGKNKHFASINTVYTGIGNEAKLTVTSEGKEEYNISTIKDKNWKLGSKEEFALIVKNHIKKEYATKVKDLNNRIEQLEKEIQELKSQGIEKLKPIEAFYEIKVGNILDKLFGKENVKTITDEFGNQWREITIDKKRDLSPVLLQKSETKKKVSINKLAKQLNKRFNVEAEIISQEKAKELNPKYNGEPAFFDVSQSKAYLVEGIADETSTVHEIFTHPFLIKIEKDDNELYNNLLKEAKSDQDIVSFVEENYAGYSDKTKDHEIIARAIDLQVQGKLDSEKHKNLIEVIMDFFSQLASTLKEIFSTEKEITSLSTLEDVVTLVLEGKSFINLSTLGIKTETENTMFQIIGLKAIENIKDPELKKNLKDKLKKAKELEKEGENPDYIWEVTHFERGEDGLWRMEVADVEFDAKVFESHKNNTPNEKVNIEHYIGKESPFFEWYPELKDVKVKLLEGFMSAYNEGERTIKLSKEKTESEVYFDFLHEFQHFIQRREGFSLGGDDEYAFRMLPRKVFDKVFEDSKQRIFRSLEKSVRNQLKNSQKLTTQEETMLRNIQKVIELSDKNLLDYQDKVELLDYMFQYVEMREDNPIDKYLIYFWLLGEREATNTKERAKLSMQERMKIRPTKSMPEAPDFSKFFVTKKMITSSLISTAFQKEFIVDLDLFCSYFSVSYPFQEFVKTHNGLVKLTKERRLSDNGRLCNAYYSIDKKIIFVAKEATGKDLFSAVLEYYLLENEDIDVQDILFDMVDKINSRDNNFKVSSTDDIIHNLFINEKMKDFLKTQESTMEEYKNLFDEFISIIAEKGDLKKQGVLDILKRSSRVEVTDYFATEKKLRDYPDVFSMEVLNNIEEC